MSEVYILLIFVPESLHFTDLLQKLNIFKVNLGQALEEAQSNTVYLCYFSQDSTTA